MIAIIEQLTIIREYTIKIDLLTNPNRQAKCDKVLKNVVIDDEFSRNRKIPVIHVSIQFTQTFPTRKCCKMITLSVEPANKTYLTDYQKFCCQKLRHR